MSNEIILCPEAVAAYKELMTNPKGNGLDIPSLEECIVVSDTIIAKHILYQQYIDLIQKPLPKVFFYIIIDELHFDKMGKGSDGNFGYKLKINNPNG